MRTSLPRQDHEMGRVDLNSFIILLKPDQLVETRLSMPRPAENLSVDRHRPTEESHTL